MSVFRLRLVKEPLSDERREGAFLVFAKTPEENELLRALVSTGGTVISYESGCKALDVSCEELSAEELREVGHVTQGACWCGHAHDLMEGRVAPGG